METDLVAELMSLGFSRAFAVQFVAEADQVTVGMDRERAAAALDRLTQAVLDRHFGRRGGHDGRERLVPPGFERT